MLVQGNISPEVGRETLPVHLSGLQPFFGVYNYYGLNVVFHSGGKRFGQLSLQVKVHVFFSHNHVFIIIS